MFLLDSVSHASLSTCLLQSNTLVHLLQQESEEQQPEEIEDRAQQEQLEGVE